MQFHYAIGRNICLSSDRTIATHLSEDYCNGYVFTSRPIRPGEKLIIEVAAVDLDYVGGLAFGMTTCDPAEVRVTELPDDSDQLLDRPEYWVVHKDVCVKPEVGDRLTFYLTRKGESLSILIANFYVCLRGKVHESVVTADMYSVSSRKLLCQP